jgi:RluA family pseudouridine synthase
VESSIKLSSPETHEFWETPVLYEDDYLLAIDKPAGLLTSPDPQDAGRPSLMRLLHAGIEQRKPWSAERSLDYLMNAHRLDFEASGVLLLAKTKPVLIVLANLFGSEKPLLTYSAIVQGVPSEDRFEVDAKLAPHPQRPGFVGVDLKRGKRSRTNFRVAERFGTYALLHCEPLTERTHQIRAHLRWVKLPIVGDETYGGKPLRLSRLKRGYRPTQGQTERPLIGRVALHAERLAFDHPVTGERLTITSRWPKDFAVALKYLRMYSAEALAPAPDTNKSPSEHEDAD